MLVVAFTMTDSFAAEIASHWFRRYGTHMNKIIYIVGLVVIVLFILGALGFR